MKSAKILISGAGIAGPALAYWLEKHGFTPTIVETSPQLRVGGFAIDVRGPGAEVVKKMGLWPDVQALSTNMQKIVCVDNDGRTVAVVKAGRLRQKLEMDEFWVETMRTDLSRVLYDQTSRTIDYIFGDSIASLSDDGAGVDVRLKSGVERRFDLVIGADGQRSTVRNLAFGEDAQYETYLGYYVAVTAIKNAEPPLHHAMLYSEPGRGVYLYRPTDAKDVFAFFMFTQNEKLDCGPHEAARHKEILGHGMTGMGWKTPELIAKAMDAPDLYFDAVSQVKMPSWSTGRVALLGDAAFAPSFLTGQGTQLALTSAYILAGELKRAHGDHARAFATYEAALRPLIDATHKQIGHTGPLIVPKTRLGIWLRNRFVPLAVSLLTITAGSWQGRLGRKPSSLIRDY